MGPEDGDPGVTAEAMAVLAQVLEAFEQLGTPYAIVGSFASSLYGSPRSTRDIDMVADVRAEHAEALAAGLGDGFYADPEMIGDAIGRAASFNVIHIDTAFKVDVFPCADRADRLAKIARGREYALGGLRVRLASPEDVILAKLDWYRIGGGVSERQWRDVLEVLVAQTGRLDMEYLHRQARAMELSDLLAKALEEALAVG